MPAANPKPKPEGEPRKGLVENFREQYVSALAEAQVSAEHTATEGWQQLYREFQKSDRELRRSIAGHLKGLADILERNGLTEEGEKEIGDAKKQCTEARTQRQVFVGRTVEPVRACVDHCQKILGDARRQAQLDAERMPLIHKTLLTDLDAEIKRHPVVTWDEDAGRVLVVRPPAPGVN